MEEALLLLPTCYMGWERETMHTIVTYFFLKEVLSDKFSGQKAG